MKSIPNNYLAIFLTVFIVKTLNSVHLETVKFYRYSKVVASSLKSTHKISQIKDTSKFRELFSIPNTNNSIFLHISNSINLRVSDKFDGAVFRTPFDGIHCLEILQCLNINEYTLNV